MLIAKNIEMIICDQTETHLSFGLRVGYTAQAAAALLSLSN